MKTTYILSLFLVVLSVVILFGIMDVSSGEHIGIITAVEKGGFPWQTYKIYFKPDKDSIQEYVYCVTDEEVFKEMKLFINIPVSLNYSNTDMFVPRWICNGGISIVRGFELT